MCKPEKEYEKIFGVKPKNLEPKPTSAEMWKDINAFREGIRQPNRLTPKPPVTSIQVTADTIDGGHLIITRTDTYPDGREEIEEN